MNATSTSHTIKPANYEFPVGAEKQKETEFMVGRVYYNSYRGDHNAVERCRVVKKTAKTVVFQDMFDGKTARRKIINFEGKEIFYMNNDMIIRADKYEED